MIQECFLDFKLTLRVKIVLSLENFFLAENAKNSFLVFVAIKVPDFSNYFASRFFTSSRAEA